MLGGSKSPHSRVMGIRKFAQAAKNFNHNTTLTNSMLQSLEKSSKLALLASMPSWIIRSQCNLIKGNGDGAGKSRCRARLSRATKKMHAALANAMKVEFTFSVFTHRCLIGSHHPRP